MKLSTAKQSSTTAWGHRSTIFLTILFFIIVFLWLLSYQAEYKSHHHWAVGVLLSSRFCHVPNGLAQHPPFGTEALGSPYQVPEFEHFAAQHATHLTQMALWVAQALVVYWGDRYASLAQCRAASARR